MKTWKIAELNIHWENTNMAQNIRNVGELQNEDWNRLILSIFSYRILKYNL